MALLATLDRIQRSGIVAVVRSSDPAPLVDVAQALVEGGVEAVEITFTVPRAHLVLEKVADQLGDRVLLGAGTVLDAETARTAILSGASFLVSPTVATDVLACGRRYGCPVMAGALTPTEVLSAWEQGADIVKVFPADVGGPPYLKSLAGPLPQVPLMPTGGVNLDTAADFLRAGACALGVGSALVASDLIQSGNWAELTRRAEQYCQIVAEVRGG